MPFSKRVLKEYCEFSNTPLAVDTVPLPLFKSPCHCALAVRFTCGSASLIPDEAGGKKLQEIELIRREFGEKDLSDREALSSVSA